MTRRPPPVPIDDLAAPRFAPDVAEVAEVLAALGADLPPERV